MVKDVSILTFNSAKVMFAAAKNPLCIVTGGEMKVIPGSKFPIGSTQYRQEKVFERHDLTLDKGTKLYIYSDGFQDQFGGGSNQKYLSKRFKEFLLTTSSLHMESQKNRLMEEFEEWKGAGNRHTDDVLIIGVEV